MRLYLRVTRQQPSGCALFLLTFAALVAFAAIGDASPAAGFAIIGLITVGALAWLTVPAWLHLKHDKLTPGCRGCRAKARRLQAAERRGAALAAQLAEYARLDAKSRRP